MLEDYKKFFPHLVSILFLLNGILLFVLKNSPVVILIGFMVIITGLTIIGESLYYIVKSRNDDIPITPAISYPLMILLGVFYNPCFSLRYFDEDEDYKKKNMIFLGISIVLGIILLVLLIAKGPGIKLDEGHATWDDKVVLKVPEGYEEIEKGIGDLDFIKDDHVISLRIIDGNRDMNDYIEEQRKYIFKNVDNAKELSDDTDTVNDKTIRTIAIEGTSANVDYVYVISAIKSTNDPKKIINIYQYCYKDNYSSYKKSMNKIIEETQVK